METGRRPVFPGGSPEFYHRMQMRTVRELWSLREQARVREVQQDFLFELNNVLNHAASSVIGSPDSNRELDDDIDVDDEPDVALFTSFPSDNQRYRERVIIREEVRELRQRHHVQRMNRLFTDEGSWQRRGDERALPRNASWGSDLAAARPVSSALDSAFRHHLEGLVVTGRNLPEQRMRRRRRAPPPSSLYRWSRRRRGDDGGDDDDDVAEPLDGDDNDNDDDDAGGHTPISSDDYTDYGGGGGGGDGARRAVAAPRRRASSLQQQIEAIERREQRESDWYGSSSLRGGGGGGGGAPHVRRLDAVVHRLEEEIVQLKHSVAAGLDLQLDIQRAIRQEVASAMHRYAPDGDGAGAEDSWRTAALPRASPSSMTSTTVTTGAYGACAVCMERPIDSVLYSCGHMCSCAKCGRTLLVNGSKCPICRAPVRDVVRVFSMLDSV